MIYLHPLDEKIDNIDQDQWVELDLVSWSDDSDKRPIQLSILRRLNKQHQEPYLQELMFAGLQENTIIKKLTLEIPHTVDSESYITYVLHGVKILNYSIYPCHPNNKQTYEKLIVSAEKKQRID